MRAPWGAVLLVVLGSSSAAAHLLDARTEAAGARRCVDTRFLADVLDAQRPVHGLENLLLTHSTRPELDEVCEEELPRLHASGGQTVALDDADEKEEVPWPNRIDLVVLLLSSGSSRRLFNTTLAAASAAGVFRHRAPVLAVHRVPEMGVADAGLRDVHTIVAALRGAGWMHTAVALQGVDGTDAVPVYQVLPGYQAGARCGFGPSTVRLAMTWTPGRPLGRDDVRFLAKHPLPKLNGCTINVAPLIGMPYVFFDKAGGGLRGVDISLVNFFASYSNATIYNLPITTTTNVNKRIDRWDRIRYAAAENLDMSDIYDLDTGEADIVIGGLFPTLERYSSFDLSTPYAQDVLYAYMTASMPVPAWRYPIDIIHPNIWAAVLGLMALIAVLLWVTGSGSLERNTVILLGVLFDGDPKPSLRPGGRALWLVFLWSVFCLHFNTGYRASLAMASINQLSRPGPASLNDVKRIGFLVDVETLLLRDDSKRHKALNISVEICRSVANCSAEIKKDPENMAIIMTDKAAMSSTPKYFLDYNMKSTLARKDKLTAFFVSCLINKKSPVRLSMDKALRKAREFGMVFKWMSAMKEEIRRQTVTQFREMRLKSPKVRLDLVFISAAMGLLVLGLFLSLVMFCAEVLQHMLAERTSTARLAEKYRHTRRNTR